jgi:hypothetical protein
MPSDAEELICVRCGLEVRVNRESYEILERMHYVCFHFEFEHTGFDPDEECDAPDCPSAPFKSPSPHREVVAGRDRHDHDGSALPESSAPAAPCGFLAPDPAFQKLGTAELLAMVPCVADSVLRRGRAVMELGRRAADDPALLNEVAALIRDPANRRLITIGPVSVSQLGTAGLIAAGAEPTTALARELAAEWPPADQSDFARLMISSGAVWPPPPAHKTMWATSGSP